MEIPKFVDLVKLSTENRKTEEDIMNEEIESFIRCMIYNAKCGEPFFCRKMKTSVAERLETILKSKNYIIRTYAHLSSFDDSDEETYIYISFLDKSKQQKRRKYLCVDCHEYHKKAKNSPDYIYKCNACEKPTCKLKYRDRYCSLKCNDSYR